LKPQEDHFLFGFVGVFTLCKVLTPLCGQAFDTGVVVQTLAIWIFFMVMRWGSTHLMGVVVAVVAVLNSSLDFHSTRLNLKLFHSA